MYRYFIMACFVCCTAIHSYAQQKELTIQFVPTYRSKEIVLDNQYYQLPTADSVMFETFRCYISAIQLYKSNAVTYTEKHSYHLLDAAKASGMSIGLRGIQKDFDAIHFNIGIDSVTNVSGVMGGDLDPTSGMYWSWQSGYINFKLEGKSNACITRDKEFQYHIGGYAGKDNALQPVVIPVQYSNTIRIEIAIDKFLEHIDLTGQSQIMIPGTEAVQLAKQFAQVFQIAHR